jgi:hypothetical protein
MFYQAQKMEAKSEYLRMLKVTAALSRLFSDSAVPYLYYRVAENIFCKAFDAENLSRGDISVDASKNKIGIGLKTFLHGNGDTFQKIAEFNKAFSTFDISTPESLIAEVIRLRNERIRFTMRAHGLQQVIYHLVTRKKEQLEIYEESMDLVDPDSINFSKCGGKSIVFSDQHHEYNFYLPKSTLFKRFHTNSPIDVVNAKIVNDPLALLTQNMVFDESESQYHTAEYIYLPLYSMRTKEVHPSSGLNQWNASGRKRDPDELYIPVPIWIHKKYKGFFPFDLSGEVNGDFGEPFDLLLPDGSRLDAKICQANGKALMSNPNKVLGKWLLRDVFQLPQHKLLTYKQLVDFGIDSVKITKLSRSLFKINFAPLGSFERFANQHE